MHLYTFTLFIRTLLLTTFGISIGIILMLMAGLPDYGSEITALLGIPSGVALAMFVLSAVLIVINLVLILITKLIGSKTGRAISLNRSSRHLTYISAIMTGIVFAILIALNSNPY